MKKEHNIQKWIGIISVCAAMLLLLIVMFKAVSQPLSQSTTLTSFTPTQLISAEETLPVVGTQEQLYQIVKKAYDTQKGPWYRGWLGFGEVAEEAMDSTASGSNLVKAKASADSGMANESADYSGTNVQVQGIDEADMIKTDGTYLYQIVHDHYGKGKVIISQIYPTEEMKIIDEISFTDSRFYPFQLYVDQDQLIVIGSTHQVLARPLDESQQSDKTKRIAPAYDSTLTKAYVYDLSDMLNLSPAREIELEGNYLSSRKIGQDVYIVTNQYIPYMDHQSGKMKNEIPTPAFKDSAVSAEHQYVGCDVMYYFPESPDMSYLNIGGFSLDRPEQPLHINSYLGGGREIYGNHEHLYVTITRYDDRADTFKTFDFMPTGAESTDIYKFAWDGGGTEFVAQGQVPGRLLNQFSMDEYEDHLRMATTFGNAWREDELRSQNLLFVLNDDLDIVGQIENIAPGEQIYSARFMGDRGYIVTFKTTDPLFVLDLQDPTHPSILGELKIPGFSNYLHPYDEQHLIGFGKDAEEFVEKDNQGNIREFAVEKGIKMSLFDITDALQPKEKFVELIGDRGSSSTLTHDHKALLFSKEKDIFAFPIEVMEATQKSKQKDPFHVHTEFTFQGAYFYGIDPKLGFQFKGRISHLTQEQLNDPWRYHNRFVQRILYIGDTIYTISNERIQANDMDSLDFITGIEIQNR